MLTRRLRLMALKDKFPHQVTINASEYTFEDILKEDFFSVNVLYRASDGQRYVLKFSDFRFFPGLLFRPVAALMSRHEYHIYQRLADIEGIPSLGPRLGLRGYFHAYIEGKTLAEWDQNKALPADFFDRLRVMVEECHRRGIFYADLNKRSNIIAGRDGRPWLIDFQICLQFSSRGCPQHADSRIFKRLIQEDIYHLYKLKRRFQPDRMTAEEEQLAQRSRAAERFNRWFGNPFRRVKRVIYPAGSNETIWYKWRRR